MLESHSSPVADRVPLVVRLGHGFFRWRDVLLPVVFAGIAVGTPPRAFLGEARADAALDVVGLVIAATGQLVRAVTIGLEYIRRGGRDKKVHADSLVQGGIFAHVRNPLYLGNLLVLSGLAVIHNGPWMYAVGMPFFLVAYACLVAAEERYLREHFGREFEEYCRRVPRIAPRLSGIVATVREHDFDWRRLVRKEYGSTFAWISAAIGLLILERLRDPAYAHDTSSLQWLLPVWAIALVGYLIARILKKTGRLGAG